MAYFSGEKLPLLETPSSAAPLKRCSIDEFLCFKVSYLLSASSIAPLKNSYGRAPSTSATTS